MNLKCFTSHKIKAVLQAKGSRTAYKVHMFNAFYVPFCNKQKSIYEITVDQLYMKSLTNQLWISLHIKVWNHFYVLSKQVTLGTRFPPIDVLVLTHSREEWRITTSRKFLHEDDCIDQKGSDHAGQCNCTIKSLCCKVPQSSSHKDFWPHLSDYEADRLNALLCCLKTAKKILHLSLVHSFARVIIQHVQQLDKHRFALNRKISFDLQWKPLLAITAHLIWNQ